jgi:hypothetical protein
MQVVHKEIFIADVRLAFAVEEFGIDPRGGADPAPMLVG